MKSRCYRHGCHRASHRALRPGLFQSPEQLSQRSSSFFTRCCIQLHTSSICKINPGRAVRCTVFFPVRQKNITTGLFQFFICLKAWRSKKTTELWLCCVIAFTYQFISLHSWFAKRRREQVVLPVFLRWQIMTNWFVWAWTIMVVVLLFGRSYICAMHMWYYYVAEI